MSPGPWSVVVFDLDGTVADTVGLIIASYDHAVNEVIGVHPDPRLARSWIGQTLHTTFTREWPDHAEALVRAYREYNETHHDALVTAYPGVSELLIRLGDAGIAVGVATSKSRRMAERSVSLLGLPLPVTVAMEDTSAHKPDPAPVLLAVSRLGGTPESSVYVGDAVVDIQAAQAAGMASIGVTWGAGDAAELAAASPSALVSSAAELAAVLLG